jgi:protein-disulfide isomerase
MAAPAQGSAGAPKTIHEHSSVFCGMGLLNRNQGRVLRMQPPKKLVPPLIVAAVLTVGYFAVVHFWQPALAFAPRNYPQGFRDLLLDSTVSQPDPIFTMPDMGAERAPTRPVGKEFCDALLRDPASPTAGDQAGTVPLVTFFDYRCPYCKVLAGLLPSIPLDNVRLVYREWAILGPSSVLAARAALAADRQGKYLALHERLMRARLIITIDYIDAIAADLGLDRARLHADMAAEAATNALQRTTALAKALGFLGTPALVVGHTIVQGEISRRELESLIEQEKRSPAKAC